MKKNLILAACLFLLSACTGNRRDIRLTSEPSIERAFDIISGTALGKPLMKFLYKNPVMFEYSNTAGICHKFALQKGAIFVPVEMRGSDLVLALSIARAAYIYRLYLLTGLEEIISEEEELGALFQARLGLEINLVNGDFEKAENAAGLKSNFCSYIMEQSRYTMAQARKEALSQDPDCQRPLDTLAGQQLWLGKMRQAMNNDNFNQLLYERDLQRVRRGTLTMSEAMKNDARSRAMPTYETYRFQRTFYDYQSAVFSNFTEIYYRELKEDQAWRQAHKADIDRARAEFSDCNMPETAVPAGKPGI
ncbi:MAG: hypothetical protein A2285_01920 [Elusimicrobia bacterium RIFOXYA12_FULL_57_11]|nr:MAG: hypothetical protein A2285_01920 [Elusimicrobia bacterium RIFOXYA12_FULL_57_11]